MSKYFQIFYKYFLTLIFFVMLTFMSNAQPSLPGNIDPGDAIPQGGTGGAVPVDGGLSLLAAAGLAYGARKAYKRKKV